MSRNVLVTGASTGIGRAIALRLDRAGWTVFAGVRRDEDAASLKKDSSDRLTPVMIDVSDAARVESALKIVTDAVGTDGLQGVVNNAGIAVAGPLEFLPIDAVRTQLEINVVGLLAVTQAALPLIRAGRGRIVNIGSIGGSLTVPFAGPYSASKFAVEALSDALRMELAPWKIEVSLIKPAAVATPIWERGKDAALAMLERMPEIAKTLYAKQIDIIRALSDHESKVGVDPDEVAKLVEHALTAAKPKTRYFVGSQVRLRWLLSKFIPDRMRDKIVFKQTGLPH